MKPETAEKLHALASERNLSIESLLTIYVPGFSLKNNGAFEGGEIDLVRAFDAWVESWPETPPLSDDAISRASIYGER